MRVEPTDGFFGEDTANTPRPVDTVLELQVELHRRGFSCGSIDGVAGAQTASLPTRSSTGRIRTTIIESEMRNQALLEERPLFCRSF